MEIIYYIPLLAFNIFNILIYYIKYLLIKKVKIYFKISIIILSFTKQIKLVKLLNFRILEKSLKKEIFYLWFNFLNDMNFNVITCNKLNDFSPMCAFYANTNINQKTLLNLFRSFKIEVIHGLNYLKKLM